MLLANLPYFLCIYLVAVPAFYKMSASHPACTRGPEVIAGFCAGMAYEYLVVRMFVAAVNCYYLLHTSFIMPVA